MIVCEISSVFTSCMRYCLTKRFKIQKQNTVNRFDNGLIDQIDAILRRIR